MAQFDSIAKSTFNKIDFVKPNEVNINFGESNITEIEKSVKGVFVTEEHA